MGGGAVGSRPTSSASPTVYSPNTGTSCKTKQPGTSRKADRRCSARRFLGSQLRFYQYLIGDLQYALSGEYEPSRNDRDRKQVELYEATNGIEGGTLNGKPVIILTFKGVKSGKIRKTPLMRIEHDGTYAVVASNGGAPTHPAWYRNIVANPTVELQDGAVKQEMRVREAFGEEKKEWWKRADAAWPDFPAYRARAGRVIPVLVLEPLRRNGSALLCQHDCGLEVP